VDSQEQTRQYLETLFNAIADNEQIHIRPDFPEGCTTKGFNNYFLDTVDEAVEACLHLRMIKAHAYVSVNPRDREMVEAEEGKGKEGSPGGKSTVSRVIALFSDYDYAKMGQSRDQALEYLRSLPCPPTMIVDSGGGLQLYWLLADPVTGTEEKAFAEKIMAAMCEWWQTDKVKDYSRVLRVPGSLNVKPEYETPRECFIEQPDNGNRYFLDRLWAMIPEEYKTPQKSSSPDPNGFRATSGNSIEDDSPIPAGSRSSTLVSIGGKECKERTWEDTRLLVKLTDKARCDPPLQEEDPKAFGKVMQSVRRYWEKDSVYSKNGEPKAEEGGHTEDQHGLPSVFNYENYRKVREQGGFPPREVVGHTLIKGLSTNIFGEAGLGKSLLLLHFAHVYLQRGERVILLDFENGHQTLFERMEELKVPDKLLDNFYPLRPEGDWDKAWAEFVSEVRPGLVGADGLIGLLDSLGLSENDSQDIEKVKGQIFRPALDLGSTFLTLDHPGNEDKNRERGSSRKGQLFDAKWKITNPGPRINRLAPVECKLILEKDRTSSLPIKVKDALTYRVGGNPFVVDLMTVISPGGLHQNERKVYEHIRGKGERGDRFSWIVEGLELSESTVDRWIKKLEERDLIRKADDGTWHITPERVDRVSIPDAITSSYEAKLDSPRRYHVLFAYREIGESTIREVHEYLNPPTMPEENISRDEVRDITQALLDMGELRDSGERGGHTLYAPISTEEEHEEPSDW
jgi:DNA-binding transcriptional ArsR family regulator